MWCLVKKAMALALLLSLILVAAGSGCTFKTGIFDDKGVNLARFDFQKKPVYCKLLYYSCAEGVQMGKRHAYMGNTPIDPDEKRLLLGKCLLDTVKNQLAQRNITILEEEPQGLDDLFIEMRVSMVGGLPMLYSSIGTTQWLLFYGHKHDLVNATIQTGRAAERLHDRRKALSEEIQKIVADDKTWKGPQPAVLFDELATAPTKAQEKINQMRRSKSIPEKDYQIFREYFEVHELVDSLEKARQSLESMVEKLPGRRKATIYDWTVVSEFGFNTEDNIKAAAEKLGSDAVRDFLSLTVQPK